MTLLNNNNNKHFKDRLNKLIAIDKIRLAKIMELVQYTIISCIFCIILGICFNKIFFKYNENYNIVIQVIQVIVQLVICSIAIFYIKKIVKLIPLIYKYPDNYVPYTTDQYIGGGAIFAIFFFRLQTNLIKRLSHIEKILD